MSEYHLNTYQGLEVLVSVKGSSDGVKECIQGSVQDFLQVLFRNRNETNFANIKKSNITWKLRHEDRYESKWKVKRFECKSSCTESKS